MKIEEIKKQALKEQKIEVTKWILEDFEDIDREEDENIKLGLRLLELKWVERFGITDEELEDGIINIIKQKVDTATKEELQEALDFIEKKIKETNINSEKEMIKLKQPEIIKETEKFIEVEIPEGKREEYNLEGYEKSGDGEDNKKNYFEYFIKHKKEETQ